MLRGFLQQSQAQSSREQSHCRLGRLSLSPVRSSVDNKKLVIQDVYSKQDTFPNNSIAAGTSLGIQQRHGAGCSHRHDYGNCNDQSSESEFARRVSQKEAPQLHRGTSSSVAPHKSHEKPPPALDPVYTTAQSVLLLVAEAARAHLQQQPNANHGIMPHNHIPSSNHGQDNRNEDYQPQGQQQCRPRVEAIRHVKQNSRLSNHKPSSFQQGQTFHGQDLHSRNPHAPSLYHPQHHQRRHVNVPSSNPGMAANHYSQQGLPPTSDPRLAHLHHCQPRPSNQSSFSSLLDDSHRPWNPATRVKFQRELAVTILSFKLKETLDERNREGRGIEYDPETPAYGHNVNVNRLEYDPVNPEY